MSWIRLLTRRHLRRHTAQTVALALLALLASALLTAGVAADAGFRANVDERIEELRVEDLLAVVAAGEATDVARSVVDADPRVVEATWEETPIGWLGFDYADRPTTSQLVVLDLSADRALGRSAVVEEAAEPVPDPVYLPAIFASGGGYGVGDPFVVNGPAGSQTFHVQGFVENVTFGQLAIGLPMIGMDREAFAAYTDTTGAMRTSTVLRAMVGPDVDAEEVVRDLMDELSAAGLLATSAFEGGYSITGDLVRQSTLIGAGIFSTMLLAVAAVVAVVLVVVIRFLIGNLIAEDMPAIGTLKAVGYTSRQIVAATTVQIALPSVVAAVVGVAAGHALLPPIAGALEAQAGLAWTPGFVPVAGIVAVGVVGLAAVASAVLCALPTRRIAAVVALRTGLPTHAFRANRLPLATTRGPLPLVLGVKAALQRPAQSLMVAFVLALVGFAGVFSVGIAANMLADERGFMNLLVGDIEDLSVSVPSGSDRQAVLERVEAVPGVTGAFYRDLVDGEVESEPTFILVADDYSNLRYDHSYAGRMPIHDNEIALGGSAATRQGLEVGDSVTVQHSGRSAEYVITGLVQSSRNFGREADLTEAGFARLVPDFELFLAAVYLADDADKQQVIDDVGAAVGVNPASIVDAEGTVASQLGVYVTMAGALSTGILVFGRIVVVLVIALVVHTSVVRGRRDLGVSKAVGFTSRELVTQVVATHVPLVAAGAAVGALVGYVATVPLMSMLLRGVGIMRVDFDTPWWQVVVLVGVITGVGALVATLAAARVRRISAYAMLTE